MSCTAKGGIIFGHGCNYVPCPTSNLRAVTGTFTGAVTDHSSYENMIAWIEAFDITSIPWGAEWDTYFFDASHTTPDSQNGGPMVYTGSVNSLWIPSSTTPNYTAGAPPCYILPIAAFDGSPGLVVKAQAILQKPTKYCIIAWGSPTDASLSATCGDPDLWVAQGCIYPQQADSAYPMIVDLPIPYYLLDASVSVVNYYIGFITPGAGYNSMNGPTLAVEQDLNWGPPGSEFTSGVTCPGLNGCATDMNGIGPNWNQNAICYSTTYPSTVDPFTGVYAPP